MSHGSSGTSTRRLAGGPDADTRHARPVMCGPPRCQAKNWARCRPRTRAVPCACPALACSVFLSRRRGRTARPDWRSMWCRPTEVELDRNGDLACHFGQGIGPEQTEGGGGDPGFDRRQRHTDRGAHVQAVVTDRPSAPISGSSWRRPGSPAIPARRARPGRRRTGQTIGPTGSPAALACCIAATSCSSCAVRGGPRCPGASMAATVKRRLVTIRCARPAMAGAVLCWPPPWPISARARIGAGCGQRESAGDLAHGEVVFDETVR